MKINEIIKTTRKIRNVKNDHTDNYRELFEMIIKHFKYENSPELIVCNSYNKHASTMFMDKWYIIYDLHLSEIMKIVNGIYCDLQSEINSDKLMYKLYAEEFLTNGKIRSSFYCAEKYSHLDFEFKCEYENNTKIANITKCQDIFILVHELSHWYFFCIADESQKEILLNDKLKIINEYFNEMKLEEKSSHTKDGEYLDRILSLMIEYVNCNDKLIEECICDMFAVSFTLNYYNILCVEYEMTPIEIAEYSSLAIHSLQLLCCIKFSTKSNCMTNNEYKDYELTIRMLIFRYYLKNYFSKHEMRFLRDFEDKVISWDKTYTKNLHTGFQRISEDIQSNCSELNNNDINILDPTWIYVNDIIDKILT